MVDKGVGIADAGDGADRQIVRQRDVDVAHRFLAIKAAIDELQFAARFEFRRL